MHCKKSLHIIVPISLDKIIIQIFIQFYITIVVFISRFTVDVRSGQSLLTWVCP